MTEDDTFERLKRIPYKQLLNEWMDSPIKVPLFVHSADSDVCNFFKSKGWTYEEYRNYYGE